MKLSTKIILPIILISAMLILLTGCMGTVPTDESPGYTPGTITGVIASPCCSLSTDPADGEAASPEYWCFYCQQTWSLQDGIEVVLTYGEDEVATTTTNDKGEFTFANVDPGKNYVVTAYCPDFTDNRPLVKDVALELLEGGSFDTKITDLVSTSLGLVVDFLVLYTDLGPEDIILEGVIADKPNFPNFPKFKKLVYEVRRVLENCELNMLTDDDLQDALCRASEEVGRETDPDLVIGCSPGYTPPPPPPGECDGNIAPSINSVLLDGTAVSIGETVHVVVGTPYVVTVNATDDGIKDALIYYASVDGVESAATTSNQVTVTPTIPGTFEVFAFAHDGCAESKWGPVTVEVHDECYGNTGPFLTLPLDVSVDPGGSYSWSVTGSDPDGILGTLSYSLVSVVPIPTNDFTVDPTSGEISWDPTCDDIKDRIDTVYTVTVEVDDGCATAQDSFNVTLNAEPCLCISADLSIFSLEIKEGSTWNEYLGAFDPDTIEYSVVTEGNASHFRFTATAECADDATLKYNWYRGAQCGDSWLTGESGYSDPPSTWISITSGGTYPIDTSDRPVCNKGGNVLFVKVTNGLDEKIYKVYVDRP